MQQPGLKITVLTVLTARGQASRPFPGWSQIGGRGASHVCYSVGMTQTDTTAWETRATAHARANILLRAAQRWHYNVTDADVAMVLYLLETGAQLYRNAAGSWQAPAEHRGYKRTMSRPLNSVVGEMIRTVLVRHVIQDGLRDVLIPALVHLRDGDRSACLFTGEDIGPIRSRLVDDLSLVDCLECEATVARGHARGL
jgi:hypothetical protein